ncbi:translation initiation factor IF3-4, chloroplastic [Argentina anserina]|uniref:translation initiation factor IF3-4, chloroplastic n=1 Tax=Argentina anserina TaxID=57926 RepID=UPI00217641E3|nr:translation initiation factor IF3-4, chloroplastic [Potentilla anserina]
MAGMPTSFASKPAILSRPTAKTTPFPFPFSQSNLFGLRFNNLYPFNSSSCSSLSSAVSSPVTARFGGGGPRRSSNDRRKQQSDAEDDDKALDISTIRSASVRLIDQKQEMVGVVSKSEAIRMADEADLDLVILSPDADPPVLRIMDYNKYRYEQQKKKRVSQKKSAASRMDLKELKMGYNIDQHDYSVRMRAAQKFLKDGDKVKVMVNLKGRENEFRNKAIELLKRFQSEIGELATEEAKSFSDRNMFIVLVPNKAVLQKAQEPSKKKENPQVNEVSSV